MSTYNIKAAGFARIVAEPAARYISLPRRLIPADVLLTLYSVVAAASAAVVVAAAAAEAVVIGEHKDKDYEKDPVIIVSEVHVFYLLSLHNTEKEAKCA